MKIKVVAAIVDTRQLTLYREDGSIVTIKQGDPRLRPILDEVIPQVNQRGYAEVDLKEPPSGFAEFQKQSGVVRFFKVARTKLTELFSSPRVENAAVGKIPGPPLPEPGLAHAIAQTTEVVNEILKHAQPVDAETFTQEGLREQGPIEEAGMTDKQRQEKPTTHTVVAHVDGKLIPDMERIETHFTRASRLGSTQGVENFLKRLASVIDERSHSIEDLLKFMERADLPVCDDGSILIYKVLNRRSDHYVDCHTGNVPQKVGSYVCMDISLVDRNRNNECSNGLHVARRGYIHGFNGDVCVIAKLAPEDVVTVPTYDANKMRVMGYHILHELPRDMFDLLRKNRPITEHPDGELLLGRMLAGDHPPVLEEVRITKHKGEAVKVTPRTLPVPVAVSPKKVKPAKALENPKTEKTAKPVNPREVAKNVAAMSRKDQAQKLFRAFQKNPSEKNRKKVIDFKKQVKLGWDKLGIDPKALGL